MAQSSTMPTQKQNDVGLRFVFLGMVSLAAALLIGVLSAFKFLSPTFFEWMPFYKLRPMHVSLVVGWIFLTATGGIYFYLPNFCKLNLFSCRFAHWHFWISLVSGIAIIGALALGKFGGREYWAFPPVLAIPILLSWLGFGVVYFKTVLQTGKAWPVYYWMWGTGIVFFFITFSESYLWVFSYFRENMVREIAVQWKSYGSLVGSWNMLIYGTAIYLMAKISDDESIARSKMAFGLYFLGLFNLMFGWAHHAYPVPFAPWVRDFAYLVSMSELFILGKIILDWRKSLTKCQILLHRRPFQFLFAADIWIFLNLVLALIISVPALNLFTHGTHVIVAHAMGATIGINTMILLASVYFVLEQRAGKETGSRFAVPVNIGFWLTNGSLVFFLGALLVAGLIKGTYAGGSFPEMMQSITPYLLVFAVAGVGLMIGMWLILVPAIIQMGTLIIGPYNFLGTAKQQSQVEPAE